MDKQKLTELADKYLGRVATEEEEQELHQWFDGWEDDEEPVVTMQKESAEDIRDRILTRLKQHLHAEQPKNNLISIFRNYPRRYAAAVVLLILGAGSYFLFFNKSTKEIAAIEKKEQRLKNDVAPGGNKAILTLADGSIINLDSVQGGTIAHQNGTAINKQEAQLVYDATKASSADHSTLSYNILTTPRGGQYQVVLPDGSKVWLNAASSIRYPTTFIDNQRNVEITGEVYFEVAHNAAKPFKVLVNGMEVQVLGTHFNVNAYNDEATINTTVLEGLVKVTKNSNSVLLKPGYQAQFSSPTGGDQEGSDQLTVIENIDKDAVVAWKNGLFYLNDADIPSVLRQVARWYDIDIEYKNGLPQGHLSGKVPRNMNLSQILKVLQYSEVNFKLDGRKLIIMP
jgi:transmembrane sensor